MHEFLLKLHWSNIPALVQKMTSCQPGNKPFFNQWWLDYWCIYASPGLNELNDSLCVSLVQWRGIFCSLLPCIDAFYTSPKFCQLFFFPNSFFNTKYFLLSYSIDAVSTLLNSAGLIGILQIFVKPGGNTGLILGLHPANKRHCYKVTRSLIGWAQT